MLRQNRFCFIAIQLIVFSLIIIVFGAYSFAFAQTGKTPQTITFPYVPATSYSYALTAPVLAATASSGLPTTYYSQTPTVCTVSESSTGVWTVSLLISGNCSLVADQAGNTTYAKAYAAQTFWVYHASQTVTFPSVAATSFQYAATAPILTATASSGLPTTYYSQTPTVCTVSESSTDVWTVSLLISGNCSLVADQAGNATYAKAYAAQTFWVYHASQTITFPAIASQTVGTTVALGATASSGLAVSYASAAAVCTVSGSTASLLTAGTCTIQATQAGNVTYSAAATARQSFKVTAASLPGAPTQLTAYAATEGAYVIFAAPSSNGGSPLTQYTATANPGGITGTSTAVTTPATGLSARVDLNGLTPGTAYTFTVTASNATGTGPASIASNAVTPTAYAPYWVADGGSLTSENPLWGDYSYSGTIYYGTAPGTAPRNAFPSSTYAAPDPLTVGTGVIEFDTIGAAAGYGGGIQPYAKHEPNQAAGNGRFNLAPYTYLTVSIWPTVSGQDIQAYFMRSIWFNGVATGGSNLSLTDDTQDWPANQFAGWEFNDNTSGNAGTGIAGNTATEVTLSGGNGLLNSAGDYYEIQQPDNSVGQAVPSILPYGPDPMVVGQWNTYNIPLTAFDSTTNGNVSKQLVLKFGLQSQGVPGTDTFYVSNLGFTNSLAPIVTLTASPASIAAGGSATLTWSSTNATSCTASGGWTGTEATSGSLSVSPVSTTTYKLTCTGAGGTSSLATATVTVSAAPAPTVTLSASPTAITSCSSSTLTWSSTNATSCTASGGWTGTEATSGTESVDPTNTTAYTLACTGSGGSASATATVTVTGSSGLAISISGNHFVNANGNPVQLRGVNLSGMEFTAIQGWDPSDPTGGGFGQPDNPNWSAIASWKANIVRIPLNEDSWLGLTCTDTGGVVHNADPGGNYKQFLANLVQEANSAGMYVILDLHWAAPGSACPMLQSQMADTDHSLAFWTSIADTYKGNPAVLFELFNEPFLDFDWSGTDPWAYLMNGTDGAFSGYPATGNSGVWENVTASWNIASYQAMINAVRATGATNVVLIGSLSYTGDLSGWLSHVPTDSAKQMAATWHAYPTYGETWENPCTGSDTYCTPGNSPQIYTEVQGILSAGYPVLITETGDQNSTGTVGSPLVVNVTAFADAPATASVSTEPSTNWPAVSGGLPQIGVLGWTWDVWGNSSNVLIQNGTGTPTDGFGQFFRSWMVNHP